MILWTGLLILKRAPAEKMTMSNLTFFAGISTLTIYRQVGFLCYFYILSLWVLLLQLVQGCCRKCLLHRSRCAVSNLLTYHMSPWASVLCCCVIKFVTGGVISLVVMVTVDVVVMCSLCWQNCLSFIKNLLQYFFRLFIFWIKILH